MHKRKAIILLLAFPATAFIIFQAYVRFVSVTPRSVTINGHKIRVEVADTKEKHYRGLSDRSNLCDGCGMLFIFEDRVQRAFVMRNMKFSLDIIFIDGDRIVKIFENLPPEGANPSALYQSGLPITKVLEVKAGTAMKYGFNIGDNIKL